MQRNKYLDDLGIPINEYGINWWNGEEKSRWKQQREDYGFDDRETWNLDLFFIEWLYSRLMMFKEINSVVDLTIHKFQFEDREYTQEEAIDFIIDVCKEYLTTIDDVSWTEKEIDLINKMRRAIRLFAEIFPAMWW